MLDNCRCQAVREGREGGSGCVTAPLHNTSLLATKNIHKKLPPILDRKEEKIIFLNVQSSITSSFKIRRSFAAQM